MPTARGRLGAQVENLCRRLRAAPGVRPPNRTTVLGPSEGKPQNRPVAALRDANPGLLALDPVSLRSFPLGWTHSSKTNRCLSHPLPTMD